MNLLTSEMIFDYFHEYVNENNAVSYPGFYKFLALTKKFDKSSMYSLKDRFKDDPELYYYIKKVCEGNVIESALLGTMNSSMSQFVLKNKHGYVDRTEVDESNKIAPEIKISIDPKSL